MRVASLGLAFGLAVSGCASAPQNGEPPPRNSEVLLEAAEPVDAVEILPSGRTLSGVFVEDPPRPPSLGSTWTFTASGGYARTVEVGVGRPPRREAGSYTIDTEGRLVLYLEQRDDARFGAAERTICELDGDAASVVTLRAPSGWSARLVRTDAQPPSGDASLAAR